MFLVELVYCTSSNERVTALLVPLNTTDFFAGRRFIALCSGAMVFYVFGWITNWSFDPSSAIRSDYFFTAQTDALLRGRLWVEPNSVGGNECIYFAGKCYGYFGLTPSILRIPILLVIGQSTQSFAVLMIPIASGLAFGASLDLCRQFAKPMTRQLRGVVFMCIAALALGPGSVLVILADPFLYQEAIVWSIAFVMLAVNCYWRWLHSDNNRYLWFSVLFCIFAAGARPTIVLVGVVIGFSLFITHRKHVSLRSNISVVALGFIVLPALFSFGTLFVKFGQPSPPANAYRNPTGTQVESSGRCWPGIENHPKYLPTNLFAYFRPDAVRLYREWPNVRFRFNICDGPNRPTYLWPLKVGEMYVEKTTSLPNTMPIPLLAAGIASCVAIRRRRTKELLLLVAVATSGLLASTTMAMTSRYLGDFYPLLATGMAMSATMLGSAKRKSTLVALTCVVLVLIPWSLLANASLLTRYRWLYWNQSIHLTAKFWYQITDRPYSAITAAGSLSARTPQSRTHPIRVQFLTACNRQTAHWG
jgi:hypothetical protein